MLFSDHKKEGLENNSPGNAGCRYRSGVCRILTVFMVLVFLATGSVSAAGNDKVYRGEILFLAHKGYSSIAPENTLPAIREAVKAGFGGVEIDVYESKKEKGKGYKPYIIVSHDKTLTRLTGKKANVRYLTHLTKNYYPVVANVNGLSTYGAQYMPTLEEVLNTAWYEAGRYKNPNFVVEIEIKGTMSKAGLKKIIRLVGKHNVRITTTKYGIAKKLKKYRKHKTTQIWMYKEPKSAKRARLYIRRAAKLKVTGVSMPATFWTDANIKYAKKRHLKLAAITQSKGQARRLINAGFNRICTDWKMFE